ncbi:hypothetical protein PHMEG_00016076 [Phytophthora megakarya]|uniref:ATP-dependent DNA helicase n=1 Tax=Phytophthora megakarya TaxID=4795 RepID=A0A225W065_9STRA|nr:hypothetical protein PHMEG_00016076 [Phytophthora megakarya]
MGVPFRGIHILLTGDFLQHPPVGANRFPKATSAHGPNLREVTQNQCVFASPEKPTRVAIINQFIYLSRSEIVMVMNLPDSKFGRMAPLIDIIPGMSIQTTLNVRTAKGVANETLAHGPGAVPMSAGMYPNIFSLFYTTEALSKCKIKLSPGPNRNSTNIGNEDSAASFCVLGWINRVERTLNALVVIDKMSNVRFANKPQQNYLLVSRVTVVVRR